MAQPSQNADTSVQLPKEGSRGPPTPPPAYAPPPRLPLPRLHAGLISTFNRHPNMSITQQPMPAMPISSVTLFDQANEMEDDDEESRSPIAIRISTALRVSSNHNLVCVTAGPADHAGAIAKAVIAAMKDASTANCGIPMIDEDGRPRPIRIEVDAGLDVNGTGNVIGPERVVQEVLRQRHEAKKRSPPPPASAAEVADRAVRAKRARSV